MNNGLIHFGCHTKNHKNLCLLPDDEMVRELLCSKNDMEKMVGEKVKGFAYPFGIFDERVKKNVMKAGFEYARTSVLGSNTRKTDRFLLGSINLGHFLKKSLFASQISFSLVANRLRRSYVFRNWNI